jgi:hypothetical protein
MVGKQRYKSGYTAKQLLDDALSTQDPTQRIILFFDSIQISQFVNVHAVLESEFLCQPILEFVRQGIQYFHLRSALIYRLGIRAASDKSFREKEFDKSFYLLDSVTSMMDLPRKRKTG